MRHILFAGVAALSLAAVDVPTGSAQGSDDLRVSAAALSASK